jgi:hypothetical protein
VPLCEGVGGHSGLLHQGDYRQAPMELCGVSRRYVSMTSRMRARSILEQGLQNALALLGAERQS